MIRIPIAVCAFVFLVMFMPIPKFSNGTDVFEKMNFDQKHATLERIGNTVGKHVMNKGNVDFVGIDVDVNNKMLAIIFKEKYRYITPNSKIEARARKFNKDLCKEMRSTDIYKSGIRLIIEIQKKNGSHRDFLFVSKQDCVT